MRAIVWMSAIGLAVLWSTPVRAHHAFAAEFDSKQPILFKEATIVKVEWINPHCWIHVDVKQPNGKVERWAIEAGTPNVLFKRGLTKQSITPGLQIIVDGYRAKDGSNRANGRNMTLPNGTMLFLGSSGTGAPQESR